MKARSKCKKKLINSAFGINNTKRDGLQSVCRKCKRGLDRRWYQENKAKRIALNKKSIDRNVRYINEQRNVDCPDCSLKFPYYVMEFDHVVGKKVTEVSALAWTGCSLKRLQEEIDKCEVVCANCHKIRTHKRRNGV